MEIGDTFTLDTYGTHLHIVVQDQRPGKDYGQVICVYLSSVGNKRRIDPRTILHKGDHPFIKEKSFVKYRNVLVELKTDLQKRIRDPYPPIDPDILERIQSQFSREHPYENIRKGVIKLFNEWRDDQLFENLNS
jgi:hypothetical protein